MPPHDPFQPIQLTIDDAVAITPETSQPAEKVSYAFVDVIRFIATIGIVYIHTNVPMNGMNSNTFMRHVNHAEYYLFIKQLFKFSTICYFMIAGFLLGDKTINSSPFAYYLRRLNVIARPYVLALILFVTGLAIYAHFTTVQHFSLSYTIEIARYVLLYSPFWYIPNYLLCLLVIVCFARYASSLYFGAILLALTIGNTWYSVYAGDNHTHTTALTGFIFYMWLGMYIKKNGLITQIKNAGPKVTGAVVIFFYLLSNCETWYLYYHTHISETLNTLRISNQLYAVAFFAFIVSCYNKPAKFGLLNPRKETYGIYLYHSFFTFIIVGWAEKVISSQFHINLFTYNVYYILLLTFFNFVICYIGATALVKLLLRYNLAWLPPI
jgi:hypothetical protein